MELTRKAIEEWIKLTEGWWSSRDLDRELDIGPEAKVQSNKRMILSRLVAEHIIKRHLTKNGVYKRVKSDIKRLDWRNADPGNTLDLLWPFKLEEYVEIYPKNIIVVAGEKSAGKTAYCLNFIKLNQHRVEISQLLPIEYVTSELGAEELHKRLSNFNHTEWVFNAQECNRDFADIVVPDKINIIDYMPLSDSFYLVGAYIDEIWERLTTGIAIVVLQKDSKAELGRGGMFSIEKSRLYITLSNKPDGHKLEIMEGKNWASETNPRGLKWNYHLVSGCKFMDIKQEWRGR